MSLTDDQEVLLIQLAAAKRARLQDALTQALDDALKGAQTHKAWSPWTDRELDLLRDSRNTPRSIARATGRTPASVAQRRSILAKQEGRTDLQRKRGPRPSPPPPPELTIFPTDEYRPVCDRCDERATHLVQFPHTRTPDAKLCPEHLPAKESP